jgi:hypothetical protein
LKRIVQGLNQPAHAALTGEHELAAKMPGDGRLTIKLGKLEKRSDARLADARFT